MTSDIYQSQRALETRLYNSARTGEQVEIRNKLTQWRKDRTEKRRQLKESDEHREYEDAVTRATVAYAAQVEHVRERPKIASQLLEIGSMEMALVRQGKRLIRQIRRHVAQLDRNSPTLTNAAKKAEAATIRVELLSFVSALTKEDENALWNRYRRLTDRVERSIRRYKLAVESSNRSRMRETRRKLRTALDMLDSVRRMVKTAIESELKQQLGARRKLQQAADKSQEVANEVTEKARAAKKKWLEAKKARALAAALYHAANVALQTEPLSSERLAKKSETKQAAKRANAAYQTALTELRAVKDQLKSALKEATARDVERAQNVRDARRNQDRLADIRDLEGREPEDTSDVLDDEPSAEAATMATAALRAKKAASNFAKNAKEELRAAKRRLRAARSKLSKLEDFGTLRPYRKRSNGMRDIFLFSFSLLVCFFLSVVD